MVVDITVDNLHKADLQPRPVVPRQQVVRDLSRVTATLRDQAPQLTQTIAIKVYSTTSHKHYLARSPAAAPSDQAPPPAQAVVG